MSKPHTLYHEQEGWIPHNGGECPINPQAQVLFQYAAGKSSVREQRAGGFIWKRRGWCFDIKAYLIVESGEGA